MAFHFKLLRKLASVRKTRSRAGINKSYIEKFLPFSPVVVEAGAHVGIDTLEMAKIWPSGMIHAFEPIPNLYSKLKTNTSNVKNIKIYPMALSSSTGTAIMHVSSGASDGSSSLLTPKEHLKEHPDVVFLNKIRASTTTLDDWARKYNVSKVDFLWLDIQGHELSVLKAAPHTLKKVKAIYTEVSLKEMYEGGALYSELCNWLTYLGYHVEAEELPWPDMGNVLFVR